jgi:mono/diheme cytochrome c family protein
MRKLLITTGCIAMVAAMVSCNKTRRSTGRAYMPDMSYSRAYETYAGLDSSKFTSDRNDWGGHGDKIFYNNQPVSGTVARGDMPAYSLPNDSTGYAQSSAIKNPLDSTAYDAKEAERLYLINCAICHGAKLDGNGPLYKNGDGPYQAKPATLVGDAAIEALSPGTLFHVITYGKNAMGSYASQLSTMQRWMVVSYIKSKQGGGTKAAAPTTTTAAADSTAKAK